MELVHSHEVIVNLGAAYPRMIPQLTWQTPIYHPNISNNGVVCLGGYGTHWVPSLTLSKMVEMLWDMVRYANFDVNSPYNREAAIWAREQSEYPFPLDARTIRDLGEEAGSYLELSKPPRVREAQEVVFIEECLDRGEIEFI